MKTVTFLATSIPLRSSRGSCKIKHLSEWTFQAAGKIMYTSLLLLVLQVLSILLHNYYKINPIFLTILLVFV
jgi:hypothetical protein